MTIHPQILAKPLKKIGYLGEYFVYFPTEIEDWNVVTFGAGHERPEN